MNLKILAVLLKGLATYVPGYRRILDKLGFSCPGGTITSEYCYTVWLQHLQLADLYGLPTEPAVVAEIGPGNSLGVGLSALLTGSRVYYAFDIATYSNTARNLQILSEIISLLKWKRGQYTGSEFPAHILTDERLARALEPHRLEQIRQCLLRMNQPVHDMYLGYMVPWDNPDTVKENSVDFILSHAVMEHVDDPLSVYTILYRWLKPGGYMSHMIDYRCHNLAWRWNGHWSYSEPLWKLMRSKRPYFINRYPHSAHAAMMKQCGFRIVGERKSTDATGIARQELHGCFQGLSDEDLITATGYFQAEKPVD
jgi:SAM-dependent methyltransferase